MMTLDKDQVQAPLLSLDHASLPQDKLHDRRAAAWKAYGELPMPSRKDTDWRFSNIKAIDLEGFQYHLPVANQTDLKSRSILKLESQAEAVFANQETLQFDALPEELASKGVVWMSLAEAIESHPDLIDEHLLSQKVELGSEKFSKLHESLCKTGSVIYVPDKVEIDLPFVAHYWLDGENASVFPHTLIIAGNHSKVTMVDIFSSSEASRGLASSVADIIAGVGAKVDHLTVQDWSEQTLSFQSGSIRVDRDAHTKCFQFNSGGSFARSEVLSRAIGSGSTSEVLGLTLAHNQQEFDQRTLQNHEVPHTMSDLLFKNSLNHQSKTIFSGLIRVFEGAKQTDAYQTNRNLLLDKNAEGASMPGLEIENDDVKCSHGATTSQIDEENLFYMQARGISLPVAKHLIALGFCEEILARFNHPELNPILRHKVEDKYARSSKISHEELGVQVVDETDVRQLQGTQ
ncbi:MAG: Fe-S cluster assembly protein SufD [Verrucomicrobiota bacterium]